MEKSLAITSYDEIERAAVSMTKSGYFQDVKDQAQAVVKILAGRELGFGAFASMQNIFIINGRPSVGANLMASAVKGSQKYDYKIRDLTDTACAIEFYQLTGGKYEPIGISKFTIEDAKKAQTKNLEKYPRNMLFARAMSNGVRWYCPDVFNGNAVYTPEELGAEVDGEGNVVNSTFVVEKVEKPSNNGHKHTVNENLTDLGFEPEPEAQIILDEDGFAVNQKPVKPMPVPKFEPKMSIETASEVKTSEGKRYGDLDNKAWQAMERNITIKLHRDELTPEQKAEYQYKLDALQVLLYS